MRKSTAASPLNEVVLGRIEMPMNWWIGISGDAMQQNKIRFRLQNGAAADLFSNSSVTDNVWHHVVATREGNTGVTSLYLDGSFQNSVIQSYPLGFAASTPISMGWFNSGSLFRYTGSVDEVALYNRVLTAAEISGHYNNGLAGIGYCTFVCGDANTDQSVDISDAVYLIAYIFSGGAAPSPMTAGDANCDDAVDISDVVYVVSYIFSGGPRPCAACK